MVAGVNIGFIRKLDKDEFGVIYSFCSTKPAQFRNIDTERDYLETAKLYW